MTKRVTIKFGGFSVRGCVTIEADTLHHLPPAKLLLPSERLNTHSLLNRFVMILSKLI